MKIIKDIKARDLSKLSMYELNRILVVELGRELRVVSGLNNPDKFMVMENSRHGIHFHSGDTLATEEEVIRWLINEINVAVEIIEAWEKA